MSTTRKLIVAFWIFIICMLLWQFYTYDKAQTDAATAHPQQTQFFFIHTNAASVVSAPAQKEGPDVQQVAYRVEENTPSTGSFTCDVTLKNLGKTKAVNVQSEVRPFRGTRTDNDDVGRNEATITLLDDSDPRAQLSTWVNFPDLAPGESSTQTTVFLQRTDLAPGPNPKPQIIFEPEKPAALHPTSRGGGD
jgi:hypothetical protein